MFVVAFRDTVRPEDEEDDIDAWRAVTIAARDDGGSLGSALVRLGPGDFLAVARWPDAEARRRFFDGPARVEADRQRLRDLVIASDPAREGDCIVSLWTRD